MAPKPLDDNERDRLYKDFSYVFTRKEIDQRIEEALNHKAARNVIKSIYLYCRNWIRKDAEKTRPRARPPEDRDVSKYLEWPDGRRRE